MKPDDSARRTGGCGEPGGAAARRRSATPLAVHTHTHPPAWAETRRGRPGRSGGGGGGGCARDDDPPPPLAPPPPGPPGPPNEAGGDGGSGGAEGSASADVTGPRAANAQRERSEPPFASQHTIAASPLLAPHTQPPSPARAEGGAPPRVPAGGVDAEEEEPGPADANDDDAARSANALPPPLPASPSPASGEKAPLHSGAPGCTISGTGGGSGAESPYIIPPRLSSKYP